MTKTKRSKKTKAAITNKVKMLEESVERARRATYIENRDYFHVARAWYASRANSNETNTSTDAHIIKPVIFPVIAQEYYDMYETYMGDYDGREPRFDLDYLFHIELSVLKFFLPHLRYSDILNEQGESTLFKVSPDNISVAVAPRWEEHMECVDLASFFVSKVDTVMGPFDGYDFGMRVASTPDDVLDIMDEALVDFSPSDVELGVLAPNYDDISKRYYDCFGQENLPSLN